jgi:hypothetical protein
MRTTIELPEDVFSQAQEQASQQGLDVNQFIAAAVMRQLSAHGAARPASAQSRPRSKLPTIQGKESIANVTPELAAQIQEEEDLASHRRSIESPISPRATPWELGQSNIL